MKVKYEGDIQVLLHHGDHVWLVSPGDELELDALPDSPGFKEVKQRNTQPKDGAD